MRDYNQETGSDASNRLGAWKTMKKMFVCLAAAASLVWAGSISTRVTLFQQATLNGVVLKPGDYKMKVDGDKLTLESGRTKAEANVKAENNDAKFGSTSIRYQNGDGKMRISEIRVGGTNTKLVVNPAAPAGE